jgi:hypothetical protein
MKLRIQKHLYSNPFKNLGWLIFTKEIRANLRKG